MSSPTDPIATVAGTVATAVTDTIITTATVASPNVASSAAATASSILNSASSNLNARKESWTKWIQSSWTYIWKGSLVACFLYTSYFLYLRRQRRARQKNVERSYQLFGSSVRFGLDIGGTLCKVVYFEPNQTSTAAQTHFKHKVNAFIRRSNSYGVTGRREPELEVMLAPIGGTFHFLKFQTSMMPNFINIVKENELSPQRALKTGGGANAYHGDDDDDVNLRRNNNHHTHHHHHVHHFSQGDFINGAPSSIMRSYSAAWRSEEEFRQQILSNISSTQSSVTPVNDSVLFANFPSQSHPQPHIAYRRNSDTSVLIDSAPDRPTSPTIDPTKPSEHEVAASSNGERPTTTTATTASSSSSSSSRANTPHSDVSVSSTSASCPSSPLVGSRSNHHNTHFQFNPLETIAGSPQASSSSHDHTFSNPSQSPQSGSSSSSSSTSASALAHLNSFNRLPFGTEPKRVVRPSPPTNVPPSVCATGGGAFKFEKLFKDELHITLHKEDELRALVKGIDFMIHSCPDECYFLSSYRFREPIQKQTYASSSISYPYLVVNIGSGVSILKVKGPSSFERVGGTSLGGGTFYGLCRALTGCTSFEEALRLAELGRTGTADLLVGDIYGGDYTELGLGAHTVAASFGKLVRGDALKDVRKEDLAKAALVMITNNIGSIANLYARKVLNVPQMIFVGNFLNQNDIAKRGLAFATEFWSNGTAKALFLTHEGYFGAIGSLI